MSEISKAGYRAGEGEPLVLIHGFTSAWRVWLPVISELVARFDVFAPTLHGHDGGPKLPPEDLGDSIGEAASHLESLLDEQAIEQAHLVGNSMGGGLALELAKRGRAITVTGLSPAGGFDPADKAEAQRIIRIFSRMQRMTRASARQLPMVMRRPGSRHLAMRDVMRHGEHVPAAEAVGMARSSINCDVIDRVYSALRNGRATLEGLDEITCPVLVAWAQHDRILHESKGTPRLRREISSVEYRVMPGVGHVPMWDDPRLVIDTILAGVARASSVPCDPSHTGPRSLR